MPSTDIDGTPILMLRLDEVKIVRACVSAVEALGMLGDLTIKNPERFRLLSEKIDKFVTQCASSA